MRNNKLKRVGLFMVLMMLLIVASCASNKEDKQRKQANLFFDTHKLELAKKCNLEFPQRVSEYIKGDEVIKYDTFYKSGVILECPPPTTERPKPTVVCPPTKETSKETVRTDTIKVPDTTKEYILQGELEALTLKYNKEKESNEINLSKLNDKLDKEKDYGSKQNKQSVRYQWMFYVLIISIGGFTAFKVLK